jgi:hypothetical protein
MGAAYSSDPESHYDSVLFEAEKALNQAKRYGGGRNEIREEDS